MPLSTPDISKCVKCGKPLADFVAYIPDLGECCMGCYREYALDQEKKDHERKVTS